MWNRACSWCKIHFWRNYKVRSDPTNHRVQRANKQNQLRECGGCSTAAGVWRRTGYVAKVRSGAMAATCRAGRRHIDPQATLNRLVMQCFGGCMYHSNMKTEISPSKQPNWVTHFACLGSISLLCPPAFLKCKRRWREHDSRWLQHLKLTEETLNYVTDNLILIWRIWLMPDPLNEVSIDPDTDPADHISVFLLIIISLSN